MSGSSTLCVLELLTSAVERGGGSRWKGQGQDFKLDISFKLLFLVILSCVGGTWKCM